MERNSPHDNTNIKVSNSFNGNIVIVGGIYLGGITSLVLLLFMATHWQQAITLAAVIVYGLVTAFGMVIVGAIAALWIRFVIHPHLDARERSEQIRGQQMKNRVVHWQENAIVAEVIEGTLTVVPLFPQQQMIEAPKQEPWSDKKTVMELFDNGSTLRDIAARTGVSYYNVQKWTSEEKSKAE